MWTGNKPMYFLELLNHKKTGVSKYPLNQNQYFIWLESLLLVYIYLYQLLKHSSVGKESACNAEDPSSIPGPRRSAGEGIGYPLQYSWASLVAQLERICPQCGRPGFDPWVGKIPWRRERLPTPLFRPGEVHGLYSPWGHKELETTEWLSLSQRNHRLYRAPGRLRAITIAVVFLGHFCRGGFSCRRQAQVPSTVPGLEQRQENFNFLFSVPNL